MQRPPIEPPAQTDERPPSPRRLVIRTGVRAGGGERYPGFEQSALRS